MPACQSTQLYNILNTTATLAPLLQRDTQWARHHVKRAHLSTHWCTTSVHLREGRAAFQHAVTVNLKKMILHNAKEVSGSTWNAIISNASMYLSKITVPAWVFRWYTDSFTLFTVKRCHRSFCTTFRLQLNIFLVYGIKTCLFPWMWHTIFLFPP